MQFVFTKLGSTLLVIALIAFGYFTYSVLGDTFINVTLKTNPTLEDGLVGHWTFDGKDITGDGQTWYDQSYTYKRSLTITAGGTSGGAATTTTNGYAILATTTLSTLMATSSGGKIEKLDANNNLPLDIIFTDDDDTTLLDYHIESYASTTGALVAWIEVENISSTTAQTFNMYYGNPNATDQSNEAGTYNSTYAGVWHLQEDPSGTAPQMLDSTANDNDGTSNGSMTTSDQVAGQVDGSLDFDGADDVVDLNDLDVPGSNITISAWVYANSYPGSYDRYGIVYKSDLNYFLQLGKYDAAGSDYKIRFGFGNVYDAGNVVSLSDLPLNTWTYLVGTYDGANTRIYFNGVEDNINSKTGNMPLGDNDAAIGCKYTTGSYCFDGLIDEVRIYNTAIHPMDILTDYNMMVDNSTFLSWGAETTFNGGTAIDTSGQGNNGTINLVNSVPGVIGQALDFNGTNDYVDIGTGPTSVKTVAFWVYPETTTEYFVNLTGTTDYIWVNGGTVTATGLTSPTIYVDGVVSSTLAAGKWQHVVVTTATAENASNLDIGRTADANYMQGKMDDIRLFNRALSAEEVKRLYQLGATTHVNVTLDTNPDLQNGLVGHWTFDGKDMYQNVADTSGQGNHGALQGQTSTTTAPGVIGQALEFDGTDDYVNLGRADSINLSGTAITLSAWFNKRDTLTGIREIVANRDTGNNRGYGMWVQSNKVNFQINDNASSKVTSATISANTWYHATAVYNGVDVRLYINGVLDAGPAAFTDAIVKSTAKDVVIGIYPNKTSFPFNGFIDEVRVYNRALSAEEVKRLYQLGATTHVNVTLDTNPDLQNGLVGHWTFDGKDMYNNVADTSGQGNHGALQGQTSTTTAPGVIGQALEFDGSDDYVNTGSDSSLDDLGPLTFTAWIKPDSISFQRVINKETGGMSGWGPLFNIYSASGDLAFVKDYATTDLFVTTSTGIVTSGTWQFIVATWDGSASASNVHIYVNGVESPSYPNATSGAGSKVSDASHIMSIGARGDGASPFNGLIDDVRIYNRVLSADEIKRLYEMGR